VKFIYVCVLVHSGTLVKILSTILLFRLRYEASVSGLETGLNLCLLSHSYFYSLSNDKSRGRKITHCGLCKHCLQVQNTLMMMIVTDPIKLKGY